MILVQKIKIVAHCKKYDKDSPSIIEGESVEITLELTEGDIALFIFKFSDNMFTLGGYKVSFSLNNGKHNIAFFKDDNVYIVVNPEQFLSELLDGYERLRFTSRLQHLFDIENDYWTADVDEDDPPIDEFDIDDEEERESSYVRPSDKVETYDEIIEENKQQYIPKMNGEYMDPLLMHQKGEL